MKLIQTLLFTLLFVIAGNCFAGTVFTIPNKAGGAIHLTDIKCKDASGFIAMAVIPSGEISVMGCWSMLSTEQAIVFWNDGDKYMYPASSMYLTDYAREKWSQGQEEAPRRKSNWP